MSSAGKLVKNYDNDMTNHAQLIPIKDYIGSGDVDADEQAKQHILPPSDPKKKKRKSVWKSPAVPKGMTTAEFNAMKTRYMFAENVLNENPDGALGLGV